MIEWGISAGFHDAAISVIQGNEILFAGHSERYSGIKGDKNLCYELIADAILFGMPEKIHWYENPLKRSLRDLIYTNRLRYTSPKKLIRNFGLNAPVEYANHHKSHAAAGYFTSKFDEAVVVCIDAIGEFDTATIWKAKGNELELVWRMKYPESLGLFYSAITDRVGLKPNEDEYILMGMAAYGNVFVHYNTLKNLSYTDLHRGCRHILPDADKYDLAAAAQLVYESRFDDILKIARTYSSNLVLGGGCALNCKANAKAFRYFDNVWILPNPGDAGSSIGAVVCNSPRKLNWISPYLGYNVHGDYPVDKLLHELKTVGIVGVCNGRAEFGPRALGNRSLLADPRDPAIKDRVNEIKKRQKFRPFAPVIMEEHAKDYFKMPSISPYMQFVSECKYPEMFPAIVHADGTSRVQTVNKEQHLGLYTLLEKWYSETGCPMLLNTSLNIKGQPLVNTREDAELFKLAYNVEVY